MQDAVSSHIENMRIYYMSGQGTVDFEHAHPEHAKQLPEKMVKKINGLCLSTESYNAADLCKCDNRSTKPPSLVQMTIAEQKESTTATDKEKDRKDRKSKKKAEAEAAKIAEAKAKAEAEAEAEAKAKEEAAKIAEAEAKAKAKAKAKAEAEAAKIAEAAAKAKAEAEAETKAKAKTKTTAAADAKDKNRHRHKKDTGDRIEPNSAVCTVTPTQDKKDDAPAAKKRTQSEQDDKLQLKFKKEYIPGVTQIRIFDKIGVFNLLSSRAAQDEEEQNKKEELDSIVAPADTVQSPVHAHHFSERATLPVHKPAAPVHKPAAPVPASTPVAATSVAAAPRADFNVTELRANAYATLCGDAERFCKPGGMALAQKLAIAEAYSALIKSPKLTPIHSNMSAQKAIIAFMNIIKKNKDVDHVKSLAEDIFNALHVDSSDPVPVDYDSVKLMAALSVSNGTAAAAAADKTCKTANSLLVASSVVNGKTISIYYNNT